jgi:hypothetical protein
MKALLGSNSRKDKIWCDVLKPEDLLTLGEM